MRTMMMIRTPQSSRAAIGGARAASLLLAVLLAACATTPQAAPDTAQQAAPDRSQRPMVGEAPDVTLPPIREFTLANGMRVLVMSKRDLPLVQLNVIVNAGSVLDPADGPGLASLTAAMLDEGAAGRSALEITDAFEMLGARFGIGAGSHTTALSLRAPTQRMPDALRTAADVLLRPDFPDAELERMRIERLTGLLRRYDDPNAIAGAITDVTLFGERHPYGRSVTEASLRGVTTGDLRSFYQRHYRPENVTAVIVGDIDMDGARRLLETAFGSWRGGTAGTDVAVPQTRQVTGRVVYIVDKPGAAQSVVRFGRIGVPRSTPDYYALEVMNTILGGSFTSRLNQNLREDKGYSYAASSGFTYLSAAGSWMAGAAVQTQSTGPALAEFMNELHGMHEPIPAEEIDRARNFLAMRYPAGFQSVAGIAARIGEMVQYNLPRTYFNDFVDRVLAVTNDDVQRVARRYIDPDNVAIFIVGDRRIIEQQVRDQNLGEIRFLEVTDVLGPMPVLESR